MNGIEISMAAEPLFQLGPIIVTNSMLVTALVVVLLTILSVVVTRRMSIVPNSRLQNLLEMIVEFLLDLSEKTAGRGVGRRVFPLIATFFIFILTANWIALSPGFGGSITYLNFHHQVVPLLRAPNADLNMTTAMALIAIVVVQIVGVKMNGGRGYLKELTTPILLAPLHFIAEISHVISLAARLFGNVMGGEVLLIVIFALIPPVVPTIFMGLEAFFGFIQALIFSVLTIVYISLAAGHGEARAEKHA
jgi:F-type H+-transporting ATPase subunit a